MGDLVGLRDNLDDHHGGEHTHPVNYRLGPSDRYSYPGVASSRPVSWFTGYSAFIVWASELSHVHGS
jgi:hypothetical protein